MNICFIISIFALVCAIIYLLNSYLNGEKYYRKLYIILIVIIISVFMLSYPLFKVDDIFRSIINTIYFILQSIAFNEDITIVQSNTVGDSIVQNYLTLLVIILPFFIAASVVSLIRRYIENIRLSFYSFKNIHIFDVLNEKTVFLASKIRENNSKDVIIFMDDKPLEGDLYKKTKGISINQSITEINLKKNKGKVTFYCFNDVIDESKELLNKYETNSHKESNFEIYAFTTNEETKMILDDICKKDIILNIVDETRNVIYELLDEHPLYKVGKNINVLLIGLGNVGNIAFKTTLWAGQIPGYNIRVTAIDKDMDKLKKLKAECPEIFKNNYDTNLINKNIYDLEYDTDLENKIKNSNYIIVALGNIEANVKVAKLLRRYFVKRELQTPEIYVYIDDPSKEKILKKDRNIYMTIGDIDKLYDAIKHDFKIEKNALEIHKSYGGSKFDFYTSEYNKNSSMASALHIDYILYPFTNGNNSKENINRILNDPDILDKLTKGEHQRWLTYLRCEGFEFINKEEEKMFNQNGFASKDKKLKIHPGLIEYEKLDDNNKYKEQTNSSIKNTIKIYMEKNNEKI